jgi:dienelactone hydrolase
MMRVNRLAALGLVAIAAALHGAAAAAPDLTIPDELKTRIAAWAAENPREGGVVFEDWRYEMADGVTTKQVTFYSDETACYAKIFYPKGFDPTGSYPAVVMGHGTNAISIAMEKYGAVFAAHGVVAMSMDYRSYGFSNGYVMLQEKDTTTDAERVTEKEAPIIMKRTRLLTQKQLEDYRAAISFLQGEPGVDPERIGAWGSSLSGSTVVALAGTDARVKAIVGQVAGGGRGGQRTGPTKIEGDALADAIQRARTGQGGETDAGFSIRGKVDLEGRTRNRELATGELMDRIPKTTAVLMLPAEKDELIPLRGPLAAVEYLKGRGVIAEAVVIPTITHFQAYGGPPFEATSMLAARWFAHHLKAKGSK